MAFGDLLLTGFDGSLAGLNGNTVRQLIQIANTALGGGLEPFDIADLSRALAEINAAFNGGFVSAFAPDHFDLPATVVPTTVPEPSTLMPMSLLIAGLAGIAGRKRSVTNRSPA